MAEWRIYVAGNSRTSLGLLLQCPIFLADFNKIFKLSAGFHN